MITALSTPQGRQAIMDALQAHATDSSHLWMAAAELARSVGASGPADPQFLADARELAAGGVVRLMGDSRSTDPHFYEAMLVPPGAQPERTPPGW